MSILSLVVLVYVFSSGNSLFSRSDYTEEMSNVNEIMTNSRGMLKTSGTYQFASGAAMTGALVQFGGAPGSMAVVGTASSGTAQLRNRWGGAVTVSPVNGTVGQSTAFSLTYELVPQEACAQLAQKLSGSNNVASTTINNNKTSGVVSGSTASARCTADSGSTGTNTLVFTSSA